MLNRMESYYLRIGSFVIMGLIIIIIGILILGSGRLFQKTIYVETYFNESVQGLSVGSPVKYRGLQIGSVSQIAFVNEIYPEHRNNGNELYSRYIYVLVAITNPNLTSESTPSATTTIMDDIKAGLRFKLTLQGLTGTAYLELNYLDPTTNAPLPIDWKPQHYYIPSAASTFGVFSDSVQYIFDELKQVDISRLFDSFQKLADTANSAMQKTDDLIGRSKSQINTIINNVQSISESLKEIVDQAKISPSSVLWSAPPPKLNPEKL